MINEEDLAVLLSRLDRIATALEALADCAAESPTGKRSLRVKIPDPIVAYGEA